VKFSASVTADVAGITMAAALLISITGYVGIFIYKSNEFWENRKALIDEMQIQPIDKLIIDAFLECYDTEAKNIDCQYDALKKVAFIPNSANMERARETLSKFTSELEKLEADKDRALL